MSSNANKHIVNSYKSVFTYEVLSIISPHQGAWFGEVEGHSSNIGSFLFYSILF